MRTLLAVSFALSIAACTNGSSDGDAPGGDDDTQTPGDPQPLVADANGCHATPQLVGEGTTPASVVLGPFVFGTGRFCTHLDLRTMHRAFFSADTDRFASASTNITISVLNLDGSVLAQGGDVVVGQTDPHAFAEAAHDLTTGGELDVVVVVEASDVTSSIGLVLLDPLE